MVLNSLPIPGDDVPLQDVIDFGRDAGTVAKRKKLMRSLERAHLEDVSPDVFRLDLEEAVEEYRTHLSLHDLRSHGKTVTFLLALPGALEEVVHLRPKRAVKELFALRERRVARLERELLAPGHEFSMIYEAERQFGGG